MNRSPLSKLAARVRSSFWNEVLAFSLSRAAVDARCFWVGPGRVSGGGRGVDHRAHEAAGPDLLQVLLTGGPFPPARPAPGQSPATP